MDLVFFLIFVLVIATGISIVVHRNTSKLSRKRYKPMICKTTAKVLTSQIDEENNYYIGKTSAERRKLTRKVSYEFEVDGQFYNGRGEVNLVGNKRKVKIYYNPENPLENTTAYSKIDASGMIIVYGILIALLILIGIPALFLSILTVLF